MRGRNSASGCFEVMTFDTKGLSIQERMIKLYDGSIERSILNLKIRLKIRIIVFSFVY